MFAMLHYCVAVGADSLLSYDIRVPKLISGVYFLALWGYLNYKLFSSEESLLQNVMYISLPVVIMFALYIPLVRALIINLPLIYVAPIFTIATSIAARFTLPITVWSIVVISGILIIMIAYIGAKMQHANKGSKEIN